MRTVLDTNVLVSGLLTPHRATGRVVDLVFAGQVALLADDRILAEYADVLSRPKFALRPENVAAVLDYVRATAEPVTARPLAVELPDADDLPFLEVAAAGAADALVTGNTRHYVPTSGRHVVPVMNPQQFLTLLGGATGGSQTSR